MSTDNVIPFPTRRVVYRNDPPLFIIEIYAGERNSFSWVVITEDPMHSPDTEQLSDYLGDMFIALNPQPLASSSASRRSSSATTPSAKDNPDDHHTRPGPP